MKKVLLLLFICVSTITNINSLNDTLENFRKNYGLSHYQKCNDYEKVFKCMTTCKSIGFKIFRMNIECKCTCHEKRKITILPFFMWRTNGTTKKVPPTYKPSLYHIAGTLFGRAYTTKSNVTKDSGTGPTVTSLSDCTTSTVGHDTVKIDGTTNATTRASDGSTTTTDQSASNSTKNSSNSTSTTDPPTPSSTTDSSDTISTTQPSNSNSTSDTSSTTDTSDASYTTSTPDVNDATTATDTTTSAANP